MKPYLLALCMAISQLVTYAQVTTYTYSPALSLPASSLYTNDHSSLTALQTVDCCCGPTYFLPALHLSNFVNSISYPFQAGFTYTIQIQGSGTAAGDLSAAQPVYFGVSLGEPATTVNFGALATAPSFPAYSSIAAYINSENKYTYGPSVVDLTTNFLTGLLGIGEFATSTTTASTIIGPFTSTSSQINIESFPVLGTEPLPGAEDLGGCWGDSGSVYILSNPVWPATNTTLSISAVLITATPTITPAVHYMCNPQTYSIPGTKAATWTVSPGGIVSLPGGVSSYVGLSCTVTKASQGNCVLTATLQPGNITASIAISTQPTFTAVNATQSGSCDNGWQTWLLDAVPNSPVANNFAWTVSLNDGSYYFTSTNSPTTTINMEGRLGLGVTYTDACGVLSQLGGCEVYSECSEPEVALFDATPNPTASIVNILPHHSLARNDQPLPNTKAADVTSLIRQVKIFDLQGRVRSNLYYSGVPQQQIDVSKLENGLYLLVIYTKDGKMESKKILVMHQ